MQTSTVAEQGVWRRWALPAPVGERLQQRLPPMKAEVVVDLSTSVGSFISGANAQRFLIAQGTSGIMPMRRKDSKQKWPHGRC